MFQAVGDAVDDRLGLRARLRRAGFAAAALWGEPLSNPWRPLARPLALRAIALRRRFPPAPLGEPIGEPRQELRRVGGLDPGPRGGQQHVDRHLARRLLVSAPGLALVVDPRANPDFAEPQIAVIRGPAGGPGGFVGGASPSRFGLRRTGGRVLGCPLADLWPGGRVVVRRRQGGFGAAGRGGFFFPRKRIGRRGRARSRVSLPSFFRLFVRTLLGVHRRAPQGCTPGRPSGALRGPLRGARPPVRHRR